MNVDKSGEIALTALGLGIALYSVFIGWRMYIAYRILGRRVEELGFAWFTFQFQLPNLSKGMPGYVNYLDGLPNDLKEPIVRIRRQIFLARIFIVLWVILLALIGIVIRWLKGHGYA